MVSSWWCEHSGCLSCSIPETRDGSGAPSVTSMRNSNCPGCPGRSAQQTAVGLELQAIGDCLLDGKAVWKDTTGNRDAKLKRLS